MTSTCNEANRCDFCWLDYCLDSFTDSLLCFGGELADIFSCAQSIRWLAKFWWWGIISSYRYTMFHTSIQAVREIDLWGTLATQLNCGLWEGRGGSVSVPTWVNVSTVAKKLRICNVLYQSQMVLSLVVGYRNKIFQSFQYTNSLWRTLWPSSASHMSGTHVTNVKLCSCHCHVDTWRNYVKNTVFSLVWKKYADYQKW